MGSLIDHNLPDAQFWMEYEGIGSPEIHLLLTANHNLDESKIIGDLSTSYNDLFLSPGYTHNKLKQYLCGSSTVIEESLQPRETLYDVLANSLEHFWNYMQTCVERIDQTKLSDTSNENLLSLSHINVNDLPSILKHDVSIGFLSVAIEYLIFEIEFCKLFDNKTTRLTQLLEIFIRLLIDAQEYDLLKRLLRFFKGIQMTTYSQYLIEYALTITTRNPIQAYTMLDKIIKFKKYSDSFESDWHEFLILNQAAFCTMLLGKDELAINYESEIMKIANQDFHSYISCINISRLLMKKNKFNQAIISLLACSRCIQNLTHQTGYLRIILVYLARCLPTLQDAVTSTLIKLDKNLSSPYYGSNWRVAQAFLSFNGYTNYGSSLDFLNSSVYSKFQQPINQISETISHSILIKSNSEGYYLDPYIKKIFSNSLDTYTFAYDFVEISAKLSQ